ncbi:MAG: ABC transporter ATP-binding protein [Actinomycetota bacterium]|jgi:ABC-type branched-subunit amino acid transport system ATPase component
MRLDVEGLEAGYAGLPVLFGIDFAIGDGELVAMLGRNGAGKSTLLKTIIGTVPATAGAIRFEGRLINGMTPHERVLAGIAFSPEGRRVFPRLTTRENLVAGARGLPTGDVDRQAEAIYELFPFLEARRHQRARTLSGGEQQMLSIGRALMSRPRLLLVEEPSQGLAPVMLEQVYTALRTLSDRGFSVLVVEQYQKYRTGFADRVLELDKGLLAPSRAYR